jgi:hypothetical protein
MDVASFVYTAVGIGAAVVLVKAPGVWKGLRIAEQEAEKLKADLEEDSASEAAIFDLIRRNYGFVISAKTVTRGPLGNNYMLFDFEKRRIAFMLRDGAEMKGLYIMPAEYISQVAPTYRGVKVIDGFKPSTLRIKPGRLKIDRCSTIELSKQPKKYVDMCTYSGEHYFSLPGMIENKMKPDHDFPEEPLIHRYSPGRRERYPDNMLAVNIPYQESIKFESDTRITERVPGFRTESFRILLDHRNQYVRIVTDSSLSQRYGTVQHFFMDEIERLLIKSEKDTYSIMMEVEHRQGAYVEVGTLLESDLDAACRDFTHPVKGNGINEKELSNELGGDILAFLRGHYDQMTFVKFV